MKRTLLLTHPDCHGHLVPDGHPERPARLEAVEKLLATEHFADLAREAAPKALREHLLLAHAAEHVTHIESLVPEEGLTQVDPDTWLSPHSARRDIMRKVIGPWVSACSTTPPSPRDTPRRPTTWSGWPSWISTSTTATARRRFSGRTRTCSTAPRTRCPPIRDPAMPRHERDPLASLKLREEDYVWITLTLMEAAERMCAGRIVSVLEGGYDLPALASSVAVHVQALMKGAAT